MSGVEVGDANKLSTTISMCVYCNLEYASISALRCRHCAESEKELKNESCLPAYFQFYPQFTHSQSIRIRANKKQKSHTNLQMRTQAKLKREFVFFFLSAFYFRSIFSI